MAKAMTKSKIVETLSKKLDLPKKKVEEILGEISSWPIKKPKMPSLFPG